MLISLPHYSASLLGAPPSVPTGGGVRSVCVCDAEDGGGGGGGWRVGGQGMKTICGEGGSPRKPPLYLCPQGGLGPPPHPGVEGQSGGETLSLPK